MEQRQWILLLIGLLCTEIIAEFCDNSQLKYEFSECLSGKKKILFWWNKNNCTNALPPILDNISCEEKCLEGQFLGFNHTTNKTECLNCPANTYSTGATQRFSSLDANWGTLPEEVERLCYWVTTKGKWTSQPCDSFKLNSDRTALVANLDEVRPRTWNILGFNMNSYLYDDGRINFEYKKKSKNVYGFSNGKFRFDIGATNFLHDENLQQTTTQNFSVFLKAGYKEFRWYYFINSRENISHLSAEISKIEITPVNYAPLFCTACLVGSSGIGASFCSNCEANFYRDNSANECVACPKTHMTYPGQNQCTKRPIVKPLVRVLSSLHPRCKSLFLILCNALTISRRNITNLLIIVYGKLNQQR